MRALNSSLDVSKRNEPESAVVETVEIGKVEAPIVHTAKVEEPGPFPSEPQLDLSIDVDWTMVSLIPPPPSNGAFFGK